MVGSGASGPGEGVPLPRSAELADSIGLDRSSVRVVDYDTRWPVAFDEIAEIIGDALPSEVATIEHVGSTSVPGLPAKPILDVAIGLRRHLDTDGLVASLVELGFTYRGDFGDFGGRLFLAETGPNSVSVHVHVVEVSDPQWSRYLAFRDGLRADPALAAEYAELKKRLATEHADDRAAYTEAKFDFVFGHAEEMAARRR